MPVTYYPAIIERGEHGFGVFFPDLPGCTSAGDTIQDAARNAEEALRGHLAAMADDGDAIPEASSIDRIAHDREVDEAARLLVRADLPGKSVRLNISMDEGLVEAMDIRAKDRGMTRSAHLADLVRADLDSGGRKVVALKNRPAFLMQPTASAISEQIEASKKNYTEHLEQIFQDTTADVERIKDWFGARGSAEDVRLIASAIGLIIRHLEPYLASSITHTLSMAIDLTEQNSADHKKTK